MLLNDHRPTHRSVAEQILTALRQADELHARALELLATSGGLEASTGLSTELALMLDGRRTGADARMLTQTAATLRAMPGMRRAFSRGELSYAQVRAIVAAVKVVDVAGRAQIDALVARQAPGQLNADPDELVHRVDDEVARLRADLVLAREDRAIEGEFLAVQPRLHGGGSFYGEADTESFATMLEALDAAAEQPLSAESDDTPSRAQQRMDALVTILEASLSGESGGSRRPRPRLLATIDIEAFAGDGLSEGARVLWGLAGPLGRLTPLATEVLACDAQVVPVIFDDARPVAVGDARSPVTSKQRTALVARDRGCRFPGCKAPVGWCDDHHIEYRSRSGPTAIDNLVLLCRRHHRTVHRHRWTITSHDDGTVEFARRGKRYVSLPRFRRRE